MEPGEIHLWTADLDVEERLRLAFRESLSPDEIERADRFLREADRRRFTAARGILRRLIGNYRRVDPAALRFAYGEKGKPALVAGEGLGFSLSHCQGRAIFALAWDRELGVDLEILRADIDAASLATRYFSAAEAARIVALSPPEREAEFFRLWTAKEAYAKVRGLGLGLLGADPGSDPGFRIEELKTKPGEFSALAYSGAKASLQFFEFSDL